MTFSSEVTFLSKETSDLLGRKREREREREIGRWQREEEQNSTGRRAGGGGEATWKDCRASITLFGPQVTDAAGAASLVSRLA